MVAIEIDPVLVQYLRAEFRDEPRLTLVEADVLKADLTQWGAVDRRRKFAVLHHLANSGERRWRWASS